MADEVPEVGEEVVDETEQTVEGDDDDHSVGDHRDRHGGARCRRLQHVSVLSEGGGGVRNREGA